LKKIDLYIIKKFLGTFFFILLLLVMIAVVIDLSEKIDNFIKSDASWSMIFSQYYLNFIPHISALLGPFFVLVAVVFFTSQLASRSEIIAMTSGGISFYRLMLPYFVGALVLGGILFYTNHYLVPNSNKERLAFEWEHLTSWKNYWLMNVHRKIDDNAYLYFARYTTETHTGLKMSLEKIEGNELTYKLNSDKAVWNDSLQTWHIETYTIRTFEDGIEQISRGDAIDTSFGFSPENLGVVISSKDEMTTPELKAHIKDLQDAGQDNIVFYSLELHRRTASVFSLIILTIIGYSLASRKVRGGLGLHIVTAIILAGLFELTSKFTTTYTTNAGLDAFWGIWIPNFVFIGIAILFVRFAQK
jgi:lipopolysaccharide export system permease protein